MTTKCNYCGGSGKTIITKAVCYHCRGTGILENVRSCKYCGEPCHGYACKPCLDTFENAKHEKEEIA